MSQPLKIRFATDVEGAKQGMANLAASVSSNALSMASALKAANDNVQKLNSLMSGLTAARAAFLPLAAAAVGIAVGMALVSSAVDQANAQLDRFIKLGSNADAAGVGVEFFQRFSEAATKAKLDIGEVEAALEKAGQAVTPKFGEDDPIKKQLSSLFDSGYLGDAQSEGLDSYRKAGTNEDRIRAAVTAMQELEQLGERLAAIDLAGKLFGTDVADRIRAGKMDIAEIADSLDRQRDDLVTQTSVDQAKQFREELDAAYKAIDDALHVSVALEGAGRDVLDVWLKIAQGIAECARLAGILIDRLGEAKQDSQDMMGRLATALGAQAVNRYLFPNQGKTIYDPADPAGPPAPVAPPAPPRRPLSFYTDKPENSARGGGAAKGSANTNTETLSQVESYINGLTRTTAALKAEVDAVGKSNAEKNVSISLAKAEELARQNNITLSDTQIAKIRETAAATADYRDKLDDLRDAQNDLRAIGSSVFQGMRSDIQAGASAGDVFLGVLGRITDRLGDMATNSLVDALFGKAGGTGGGAASNLLSTIMASFGGAHADGGEIGAGKWALVGEKGPELIGASSLARTVVPNGGKLVAGGGGGARTQNVNYTDAQTFNVTPANGVTPQQLAAVIAAERAENRRTFGQQLAGWKEDN